MQKNISKAGFSSWSGCVPEAFAAIWSVCECACSESAPDVGTWVFKLISSIHFVHFFFFSCSFIFSQLLKATSYTFELCSQKTLNYHNGKILSLPFWVTWRNYFALLLIKRTGVEISFCQKIKAVYKRGVLHWERYQHSCRNFSNQQYITKLVAKQNMFC